MEIGILGLPGSGKTTVFNALTRGSAEVAAHGSQPNMGAAILPDSRVDRLAEMHGVRKRVYASANVLDLPSPAIPEGGMRGISGQFLNDLQPVDALLLVARAFQDDALPHVDGGVDPLRDVENMLLELMLADLQLVERRLERLDTLGKGARGAEREAVQRERALLERIRGDLERETPIREQRMSTESAAAARGFPFMSAKPLVIVLNMGEGDEAADQLCRRVADVVGDDAARVDAFCGKLEMELSQMEPEEEREFRESLGLERRAPERALRLAFDVIGLVTFLTVGDREARAWEIRKGGAASAAAGKIHSDMERGFIRAEVTRFDDLMACGGIAEARRRGLLRHEGRDYAVQEGDVMRVLFNV